MNKEDKELLLRDLYGRLPYEVKVTTTNAAVKFGVISGISIENKISVRTKRADIVFNCTEVKPYLFPLSSMTEEQYNSLHELGILDNCSHSYEYVNPHIHGVSFIFKGFKTYSLELIDWLNAHHFDYRGLIEKGLAKDATNLNIYQL